jgi:hypothetical protein
VTRKPSGMGVLPPKPRKPRPRGYYDDWSPRSKTLALLDQVYDVLDEYKAYLPLTARQIFYRLVGKHGYDKTEQAYARLTEMLAKARRARLIPFNSMRDDGVSVMSNLFYEGVEDFYDEMARRAKRYRRNYQSNQDQRIELWCEAAGMMPQMHLVADQYSIPVYSCGGFQSLSAVRGVVDRVVDRDCPTIFLHVGDYDPSGESIFDSFTRDIEAFVEDDLVIHLAEFEPVRVALTPRQIKTFNLPTAPPKPSDSRTANWKGGGTCQVEALTPAQLAAEVEAAIVTYMDFDLMVEMAGRERRERIELTRALNPGPKPPPKGTP